MNRTNLHIYPSNFKHETRILKETKSLADSGTVGKVFIAAIWESGVKEHEQLDSKREVWRVPLKTLRFRNGSFWKVLKFIEWHLKIYFKFKKKHIKIVSCHSLSTLPIGAFFKLFIKSKLVYDAHELETEVIGSVGIRKKIARVVERLLLHFVDTVIVVSESIANWYKKQYSLKKVYVIKNVPYQQKNKIEHSNILKKKFNIQDDELLFIFQGSLSEGRGIKMLLDAFSKVDKKRHIIFMGNGDLEKVVKEYENNFSNVHHHQAVKPEEITIYTKSADVGICLTENTCLNHFYSLPNKLFEYILSGLPIIVSDFPDMGKIVDEHKCGWKVLVAEKAVTKIINTITQDIIYEKRVNALRAKDHFGWHLEEPILLSAYRKLDF